MSTFSILTYLTSSRCWRFKHFQKDAAGFTLVELMVSISIMVIIMSTVAFRFATFDSTILLKTLAYDVGLSVRTAQTYSLSVFGTEGGQFRNPYGLSFTPDTTEYYLFAFSNETDRPNYTAGSEIDTYQLGRTFKVTDVCVDSGSGNDCDISRVDISFRRPEYAALFYVPGFTENQNSQIESATVKLQANNPSITGVVEVGLAGGIRVSLETE